MKKKSLFLFIFAGLLSSFSMKLIDDLEAEKAFEKAFAQNEVIIEQSIKTTQAAVQIKEKSSDEIENFDDVESLDFYNVNTKEEEFAYLGENDLDEEKEILLKAELLPKKIESLELTSKMNKVINNLNKERTSKKFGLSLKEPVRLSKVISKQIESTKWSSISIDMEKYTEPNMEPVLAKNVGKLNESLDRISSAQSAPERLIKNDSLVDTEKVKTSLKSIKLNKPRANKNSSKNIDEDLVFFDYSNNKKEASSKNTKQLLSATSNTFSNSSIDNSINEIQKKFEVKSKKKGKWKIPNTNTLADINNKKTNINKSDLKALFAKDSTRLNQTDYILRAYDVKTKQDIHNFDLRFSDDRDEILNDNGEGEVVFKSKLNNDNGIRRATIFAKGHIPTTIDLILEESEIVASIPVFTLDHFNKLMSSQNLRANLASMLIELDKNTDDAEIQNKYERKLYLNKNLNVVQRDDSDFDYILFVGVEPGNSIISFKDDKSNTIEKIVHLERDEVYYEPNFYFKNKIDEFDLFEENLLSKTISPLVLDSEDINGLTFSTKPKKVTLNKYSLKNVNYPSGTRSYLELNHLNESVYIGRWNNKRVLVPSETYMRFVLGQFSIGSVNSQCLVQINLTKSAKELYFNGKAAGNGMRVQSKILDSDGQFYSDLSSESEKIFILGEEQGIINIKIKYADGTDDYLQSYCSNSTYLVEQL